jgi:hypothetical protein
MDRQPCPDVVALPLEGQLRALCRTDTPLLTDDAGMSSSRLNVRQSTCITANCVLFVERRASPPGIVNCRTGEDARRSTV